MPTLTLKDQTPTTTITFASFKEIHDRYDDKNFMAVAIPPNNPSIIIPLLSVMHVLKIKFQLVDDPGSPPSPYSAADKWANLVNMLKSGGDSNGFFTLTFDSEDSTIASEQLESYDGGVKNWSKRTIVGEHIVKIDGEFEFYEGVVKQ